ncbi:MAG: hypothetical protein FWE36_08140 [Erysipelotrichales bacterium]|nr:hypothetical protein [Erysipelotrichales bacterium]
MWEIIIITVIAGLILSLILFFVKSLKEKFFKIIIKWKKGIIRFLSLITKPVRFVFWSIFCEKREVKRRLSKYEDNNKYDFSWLDEKIKLHYALPDNWIHAKGKQKIIEETTYRKFFYDFATKLEKMKIRYIDFNDMFNKYEDGYKYELNSFRLSEIFFKFVIEGLLLDDFRGLTNKGYWLYNRLLDEEET